MSRKKLIGVSIAALVLGLACYRALHRFPLATAGGFVAPRLDAIPAMQVCWVEYGGQEVSGQLASAGLSTTPSWHVTVSGLAVRHPRGDVVIDVGNSSHFQDELSDYGALAGLFLKQGPGSNRIIASAPDALRARGVNPLALYGILLSHSHPDHMGGLVDMPSGVPVLMAQEEIDYVARIGKTPNIAVVPAHARALGTRARPLVFEKKPYEIFDESADLFGDGSVVVVKLPGHTPGSVGTFVNLSAKKRVFHVGDVVNVREGYRRRVGKSFAMAWTDDDGDRVGEQVSRLAQLHALDPDLLILPAHDREAWSELFGSNEPTCIGP